MQLSKAMKYSFRTALAAGIDAGDAAALKAGRVVWGYRAFKVAIETFNELYSPEDFTIPKRAPEASNISNVVQLFPPGKIRGQGQ